MPPSALQTALQPSNSLTSRVSSKRFRTFETQTSLRQAASTLHQHEQQQPGREASAQASETEPVARAAASWHQAKDVQDAEAFKVAGDRPRLAILQGFDEGSGQAEDHQPEPSTASQTLRHQMGAQAESEPDGLVGAGPAASVSEDLTSQLPEAVPEAPGTDIQQDAIAGTQDQQVCSLPYGHLQKVTM